MKQLGVVAAAWTRHGGPRCRQGCPLRPAGVGLWRMYRLASGGKVCFMRGAHGAAAAARGHASAACSFSGPARRRGSGPVCSALAPGRAAQQQGGYTGGPESKAAVQMGRPFAAKGRNRGARARPPRAAGPVPF